ncbi:MAG: hypothetical protein ACXVP1_05705 [Thermoleophilia bacterium]
MDRAGPQFSTTSWRRQAVLINRTDRQKLRLGLEPIGSESLELRSPATGEGTLEGASDSGRNDKGEVDGAVQALAMPGDRARVVLLAGLGCFALAIGVLAYLTDRSATHAMLIPSVVALAGARVFGALGQWLPSLVHPFAFSLFTAAALPASARNRILACVAWFAVDVAFEIGQHPRISGHVADALREALGPGACTQVLANYFVRGTFDLGDIAATAAGSLAAACVLFRPRFRSEIRRDE